MKEFNIHEGIDGTLMILQHRFKANATLPEIEVIKEYGNLPLIECYPGQLNQVFINLISNAIDALRGNQEKTNRLASAQSCERLLEPENAPTLRVCTEAIDNHQVLIRIIDNGAGMPEAIHNLIFNPFFCTKPIGKGAGLEDV